MRSMHDCNVENVTYILGFELKSTALLRISPKQKIFNRMINLPPAPSLKGRGFNALHTGKGF